MVRAIYVNANHTSGWSCVQVGADGAKGFGKGHRGTAI
jgi:hypothetical protein